MPQLKLMFNADLEGKYLYDGLVTRKFKLKTQLSQQEIGK